MTEPYRMTPRAQYGLTPVQQRLLAFITERITATGVSPSYAEMAAHLGLHSKSGSYRIVAQLVDRGRIAWMPGGRARSIALVPPVVAPLPGLVLPSALYARALARAAIMGTTTQQLVEDAVNCMLDYFDDEDAWAVPDHVPKRH